MEKLSIEQVIDGLGIIGQEYKKVIPDDKKECKAIYWGIQVMKRAQELLKELQQKITDHIKWNEAHTKRIVEMNQEIEQLKKENKQLMAAIENSNKITLNASDSFRQLKRELFLIAKCYKKQYEQLAKKIGYEELVVVLT